MAKLLITGGAGFIGSQTCLLLLQAGHHLMVLDDFSNSSSTALKRVGELVGGEAAARLSLVQGDIRNGAFKTSAVTAGPGSRPIQTDTPDTGHKLSVTWGQSYAGVLVLDSTL